MILRTFFLFAISFCFLACGGDNNFDDYREAWIGTYECTKSSRSFDDDMFSTDIEVLVEIDTTASDLLLINGVRVPVDANGRFGLEVFEGSYYDLDLTDDSIRFSVNEIFPFGLAIPCFIKGDKQ